MYVRCTDLAVEAAVAGGTQTLVADVPGLIHALGAVPARGFWRTLVPLCWGAQKHKRQK